MTQDEIIEMAKEVYGDIGWTEASIARLVAFANLVAAKATQKEQDRCCAIVFGQCESDNVAQRTVDAIRDKA